MLLVCCYNIIMDPVKSRDRNLSIKCKYEKKLYKN